MSEGSRDFAVVMCFCFVKIAITTDFEGEQKLQETIKKNLLMLCHYIQFMLRKKASIEVKELSRPKGVTEHGSRTTSKQANNKLISILTIHNQLIHNQTIKQSIQNPESIIHNNPSIHQSKNIHPSIHHESKHKDSIMQDRPKGLF